MASSPFLSGATGICVLLMELAMPLVLVFPRTRLILVPAACLFLMVDKLIISADFLPLLFVYTFWLPERLMLPVPSSNCSK